MTQDQWVAGMRSGLFWLPIYGVLCIVFAVVTQVLGQSIWYSAIALLAVPYAALWIAMRRKLRTFLAAQRMDLP